MIVRVNGQPHKIYTRAGGPYLGQAAAAATRIPSGHPKAFFEAFANVYRSAYDDMIKRAEGKTFERANTIYPNVYDGVEGMYFIKQCVAIEQAERRLAAAGAQTGQEVAARSRSHFDFTANRKYRSDSQTICSRPVATHCSMTVAKRLNRSKYSAGLSGPASCFVMTTCVIRARTKTSITRSGSLNDSGGVKYDS